MQNIMSLIFEYEQDIFPSVHSTKRRRSWLRQGFVECSIWKIDKLFGSVI